LARWEEMASLRATLVAVGGLAIAAVAAGVITAARTSDQPQLPPAKQALLDQEQARIQAARAGTRARPKHPGRSSEHKAIPARVGGLIHEIGQGPFRPTDFQNNDVWQGPVGGAWIQVYAGSNVAKAPPVGELRLYSMPITPNDGPNVLNEVGPFRPPAIESSLWIDHVNAVTLTVRGPSGRSYAFNVATRRWAR
jgi:hypothetical protein